MIQTHAALLVHGYKQLIAEYRTLPHLRNVRCVAVRTQAEAPQDLEEMRRRVRQFGRLEIALENGESSIYGSARANAWFRLFHDMGHLIYNREMTYVDEVALAKTQWLDLEPTFRKMGANEFLVTNLAALYFIDTVGQSHYHLLVGKFPDNQAAFAKAVYALLDPDGQLQRGVLLAVDMLVKHGLYKEAA